MDDLSRGIVRVRKHERRESEVVDLLRDLVRVEVVRIVFVEDRGKRDDSFEGAQDLIVAVEGNLISQI